MDKQTLDTINKASIPKRKWDVEINLSGHIIGRMTVTAVDEDKAKEMVFMKLRFKVKKGY